MNQTINKQRRILVVVIVVIIVAVLTGILFAEKIVREKEKVNEMGVVTKDAEELDIPYFEEPTSEGMISHFDLKDKKVISEGKYGFRKKVTFDQRTAVRLEIFGDKQASSEDVRVGLYKDQNLEKPIEETAYKAYVSNPEEEEPEEVIPEHEDGAIFVDAGTYYVGLYTTNPFDDYEVNYDRWYGEVKTNHTLKEDIVQNFVVQDAEQVTYFKFRAKQTGKIKAEFDINKGKVELIM